MAGIGYAGLSLAVLLSQIYEIVSVDIIDEKVNKINHKILPVQDGYMEQYLREKDLNLSATLSSDSVYADADYVIITTPTNYYAEKTV